MQRPLRPHGSQRNQPPQKQPSELQAATARPVDEGRGLTPLCSPNALRRRLPVTSQLRDGVRRTRHEIADVLHGRDRERLVVVVGPCSIHDPQSAIEYARRLATAAARHKRDLVVVMRTYFEKPRSVLGWKGLLNDPDLDGSCDTARGIELSRALLVEIGALGLPCASELLDPIAAPYLEDLLAWAAIGARTATSQTHRELASRLPMPVGFKNGPDGDIASGIHGAVSARSPHTSLAVDHTGRAGRSESAGNPDAHLVLRGGGGRSNHGAESVAAAAMQARSLTLARPLFVDCSHANSGNDHERQPDVCREVLAQVAHGQKSIAGLMLEGHLEPGRQVWETGQRALPRRSITDACMGWQQTEDLLAEAAASVQRAR
jgi:3-deoxy-7-phosphoheptulonate synthase